MWEFLRGCPQVFLPSDGVNGTSDVLCMLLSWLSTFGGQEAVPFLWNFWGGFHLPVKKAFTGELRV